MHDEIVVFITAPSENEAIEIARALVAEHLVACANIVPGIRSIFFWEGHVQDEREILLIGKSRLPLLQKIIEKVKSIHSYAVPEIIALPIAGGSQDYITWIHETVKD